ncbi:MAG: hypothetical protein V3V48_11630 [Candidatus Aminicenantaceae bacterium]
MKRKIISVITLVAFFVFTISCAVHQVKKMAPEKAEAYSKAGKKVRIIGVVTISGERFDFPKKNPGTILGDKIVSTGSPVSKKTWMELEKSNIQRISKDAKDEVVELTTKDGKIHRVEKDSYSEFGDKVAFTAITLLARISIPLSEVELVAVRKLNPGGTFIATIGGLALVGLIAMLIVAALKESCPFIYSFDGKEYMFDAEPYGGATCEGLKRTEWCSLEYLEEVDGLYKIMIKNEVDETQYTDEIKLLVVDHPKGVKVVPDEAGNIHTFSQPIIPSEAYDNKGRNLRFYVAENDWIHWSTREEDKSVEKKEDLRQELVFEFPKPEGAVEAKLLFNGCNTLWASHMVKQFLELYGNKVENYYAEMATKGPAYNRTMHWNEREELYRLHIRVETEDGWKSKGTIVGGGPFVSEDRIYTIDLRDVPGDTLRIKLTPPKGFWQINHLAVDYTEDLPVDVTEIAPIEAYNDKNQDVLEILAFTDNDYLVMPEIGDSTQVTFLAVPQKPGMDRSYILKASGYYDIHLEAHGESRMDILTRFLTEPGYTIQYSLEKYFEWKKENAKTHHLR